MKLPSLALLAAGVGLALPASASYTWKDIQFGGFASQGYLYSTNNDYLGETSSGTADFREYGLNASWSKGAWRVGGQVFGQKLGDYGDDEIKLDWAAVDYQPFQWLGVRAGRVKMPRGLYNESLDLDAVRPYVLLPQSVYDARLRDFNAAFDGAMLYGNVELGKLGSVDYRLFYGEVGIDLDSGANDYFNNDVPYRNLRIGIDSIRGGTLFWNTPLQGLRVGYSYSSFENFSSDRLVEYPPSPWFPEGYRAVLFKATSKYERQLLSAEYVTGDWTFAGEAGRDHAIYGTGIPGQAATSFMRFDSWYAYLSAARRINKWLEVGTYYSYSKDTQKMLGDSAFGFAPWVQNDYAVSARIDVNEHVIVKFEAHRMLGSGKIFDTPDRPQPTWDGSRDESWMLFTGKVTFLF